MLPKTAWPVQAPSRIPESVYWDHVTRDDFTFFHTLRVRWAEVDRQDVVFNAHYFLYFDVTTAEYWRAVGFDYPDGLVEKFGTDIFAVKATAEYHASATYDDVLEIGCRVAR